MSYQGLDPEATSALADRLDIQGGQLDAAAEAVDRAVREALDVWPGADADDFSSWWSTQHRPVLLAAARATHDAVAALRTQIQDQLRASGTGSGSAGSASGSITGFSVSNGVITLVSATGAAYVFGRSGSVQAGSGSYRVNADGSLTFLGADGSLRGTIDKSGVQLNADGSLKLLELKGDAHAQLGLVGLSVAATGFAGAQAHGGIGLGLNGVHAGGSAFAGLRGEVSGAVDVGGVGARAGAEGWIGVGVEAEAGATFEDGEFHVSGSFGAAVGLGGSVDVDLTLDYEEAAETMVDLIDGFL